MINLHVTRAAAPHGYYYAPDPSSQQICSIGGNVAENSGGAHCLKYGFTTNHVTGLELVAPDGELVRLGGKAPDPPGYDLLGAFVGSEGTLGIATEVTVRLMRAPGGGADAARRVPARPTRPAARCRRSSRAGVVPAAIEMMDALAIEAAEAAVHCGYPHGAGAVLIVELDGPAAEVEAQFAEVERHCRDARRVRDPDRGRRRRAGAVLEGPQVGVRRGRPDQPRLHRAGRRDPADRAARGAARAIADAVGRPTGVRVANVFHAGDGNLHPLVLFDDAGAGRGRARRGGLRRDPRPVHRARRLDHRRARRRRGQGEVHAADVHRRRPRHDAAAALRVRPARAGQPRQGLPDPAAVRRGARAGTRARTRWPRPALAEVF